MLTSVALKCLACWREVVAMDKGCCPSEMLDVNVLVVNVLDGRVGPVQYQARWINKERRLRMLLVPHAETLADPYKGKTPLPRVPKNQEPFASRNPKTWNARTNQYLEQSPETHYHRMHSFPPIATE